VAKRSDRLALRPRIVTDAALAQYLGKSVSWLTEHRLKLEAQGLPKRLAVIGGNDLDAVDQWLDRLHTNGGTNGSSTIDADALWARATGTTPNVGRN
jgi:gamma-glutamylcysteine synthetase